MSYEKYSYKSHQSYSPMDKNLEPEADPYSPVIVEDLLSVNILFISHFLKIHDYSPLSYSLGCQRMEKYSRYYQADPQGLD